MSRWEIRIATVIAAMALGLTPTATTAAEQPGLAIATLETLPVKGRAPKTGYTRDLFGQAWADVDRNGCDTRNDILKRDLTSIIYKAKTRNCVVLSGTLLDRYSGESINFIRGNITSMEVQIDHVVALSNAWQTGAFKLTAEQRKALANDPMNLFAVKGRLNSQKGDGDAATWLPPLKSFRCAYVAQQIAVKAKYSLWVVPPEKAAMLSILAKCPTQKLPTS
ncbi:HNH endonuclease [Candidatus Planktophila dulcis]|uniref:HNH endonuclease family protein n=1 Tax=Candidatus Planktophila dulcis TaxID=1884914 RepID=UPI000BACA056|nr:HNH endonuclease family protein [Candidatus Planktophila dulcis]ASY14854.1 HNH endonuclease [Candidatus Planktophila dulcis]